MSRTWRIPRLYRVLKFARRQANIVRCPSLVCRLVSGRSQDAGVGEACTRDCVSKGGVRASLSPANRIVASAAGARSALRGAWSGLMVVPRLRATHVEHEVGSRRWAGMCVTRTRGVSAIVEAAVRDDAVCRVGSLSGCDGLLGIGRIHQGRELGSRGLLALFVEHGGSRRG